MTKHYDDFGLNKVTMTSEEFIRTTSAWLCDYGQGEQAFYEVDGQAIEVEIKD